MTEVETPYFQRGLIYIPVRSFERKRLIVATPHVALAGAQTVMGALESEVIDWREAR